MENASKALIMAGGMLIAVIILTIGVYIFATFGGQSREIQKQVDIRVIAEFNNNFTKYESSNEITIHDIVNLANFANKNNIDFEPKDDYYVSVFLNNKIIDLTLKTDSYYIELLEKDRTSRNQGTVQYYKCDKIEYVKVEDYQRVKSITFKKAN